LINTGFDENGMINPLHDRLMEITPSPLPSVPERGLVEFETYCNQESTEDISELIDSEISTLKELEQLLLSDLNDAMQDDKNLFLSITDEEFNQIKRASSIDEYDLSITVGEGGEG
jgi:hypothetical protein